VGPRNAGGILPRLARYHLVETVLVLARIKNLFGNLVIYGLGDAATSIVSLLLLPVFSSYLSPADYGIITMLLTIEAVTKVLFRWGVDTAFMRLYYDCADQPARQQLASTIFFFLLTVNGTLVAGAVLASGWLSARIYGTPSHAILIALTVCNTFVANFYFIVFQVLRIGQKSAQFIALSFIRSAGTIVARLALVVWAGMGVFGIVAADVMVTAMVALIMTPWFASLIRPVFSREVIREALGFGLPRVPHSVASQIIGFADRYFLNAYGTLSDVGLYSVGASFGLALKFFLGAFETAWTPFFLGLMRERDAKRVYSTVSTYVVALLILLVAGLCATAPSVVRLFTNVRFHSAAAVTPWIALGVMFQGLYLVGSIGLVITKRTKLYPLATGTAAAVSLSANALLIPRFGMMGAAWANMISYATLATVTVSFSWYVYPIQYEWSRLLRVAAAGLGAYLVASRVVSGSLPPVAGILLAGTTTVAVYAVVLASVGFFHAGELRALREIRSRAVPRRGAQARPSEPGPVEMAGEIIDTPPLPPFESNDDNRDGEVSPDSRFPRR
jgi:O-antigen/teichoic acid export membrane protein